MVERVLTRDVGSYKAGDILDVDWITAPEVRSPPPVPHDELSELHG